MCHVTFYVTFDAFLNCIFPSLDHLKISHMKSQILPWYHIPVKTMWPICSYQYLILFCRDLWHVALLFQEYYVEKKNSAPLVQHISELCTHFPTRNDLNSFTIDYITVSNKYHFIKAMQDTVCVYIFQCYMQNGLLSARWRQAQMGSKYWNHPSSIFYI